MTTRQLNPEARRVRVFQDGGRWVGLAAVVIGLTISAAQGQINLEWRPATATASVGDTINIRLYAVSAVPSNVAFCSMQVIFQWDPTKLQLVGLNYSGSPSLWMRGFMVDPYGLNEVVPPADGNGLFVAAVHPGESIPATPAGTLMTTFVFRALASTPSTQVTILESAGTPPGETFVIDDDGFDVTGTLGSSVVKINPALVGDFDGDGDVDLDDLPGFIAVLLGYDPNGVLLADMNGDGKADGLDVQYFVNVVLQP